MRSITSKCVDSHETGKMLSFMTILLKAPSLAAGSSAFRQLYNATLDIFPASAILMKASLCTICGVLSYVVYCHRWRVDTWNEKKTENYESTDEFKISHM